MKRATLVLSSILLASLAACAAATATAAEEEDPLSQLNTAAGRATGKEYSLRYKLSAGETLRYRVQHLVKVDTSIEKKRQRANSSSVSTKLWHVKSVDDEGAATFVHQVADVDMRQKVDGRDEVRYSSKLDATPPLQYEKVAEAVGVPLAEVTIDPHGVVLKRQDRHAGSSWGGQLIVPLPPKPVKIGDRWHQGRELAVKLQDGRVKQIKLRKQYELKSVGEDDNIALIAVNTQILTPGIKDRPKVMVQIVQRLVDGTITFNIDQGRVVRQKLRLDKTVIGFNGPKSIMTYAGRFTEELAADEDDSPRTASRPAIE